MPLILIAIMYILVYMYVYVCMLYVCMYAISTWSCKAYLELCYIKYLLNCNRNQITPHNREYYILYEL